MTRDHNATDLPLIFYKPDLAVVLRRSERSVERLMRAKQLHEPLFSKWKGRAESVELSSPTGCRGQRQWFLEVTMRAIVMISVFTLTLTASVASASWSTARILPGPVRLGKPSCVSAYAGIIDCFAMGADNQFHQIRWTGSQSAYYPLGGSVRFYSSHQVTCVAPASARINCFVASRGEFDSGASLWHRLWDGNLWRRWESLGSPLADRDEGVRVGGFQGRPGVTSPAAPSCVSSQPGTADCFVRGSDGAMLHRSWDGYSWGEWDSLGGVLQSNPSCTSRAAHLIDCFVIGTDRGLWRRWFDGTRWNPIWDSLGRPPSPAGTNPAGAILVNDPACVSYAGGSLHCLVAGFGGLYHRFFANGSWSPWQSRQGELVGGPSCVMVNPDRIMCVAGKSIQTVATGTTFVLQARLIGGPGGSWETLQSPYVAESTTCVSVVNNRVDCFTPRNTGLALLTWTP